MFIHNLDDIIRFLVIIVKKYAESTKAIDLNSVLFWSFFRNLMEHHYLNDFDINNSNTYFLHSYSCLCQDPRVNLHDMVPGLNGSLKTLLVELYIGIGSLR